jgi:hypothetical protein
MFLPSSSSPEGADDVDDLFQRFSAQGWSVVSLDLSEVTISAHDGSPAPNWAKAVKGIWSHFTSTLGSLSEAVHKGKTQKPVFILLQGSLEDMPMFVLANLIEKHRGYSNALLLYTRLPSDGLGNTRYLYNHNLGLVNLESLDAKNHETTNK